MADERDPAPPPGMPRWVKVFVAVAAVAVAVALVGALTGRGGHGPGRHLPQRHGLHQR